MASRPVWITPAGSLGTIEERVFYSNTIHATNESGSFINYSLVSGKLPPGMQLKAEGSTGMVEGVPRNVIEGSPDDVSINVTSRFVIRAESNGAVNDREFFITVAGQNPPVITTPSNLLGAYLEGTRVDIQLEGFDLDDDPLHWRVTAGNLPPGLRLSRDGKITGWIEPTVISADYAPGFSANGFDVPPFDYSVRTISRSYSFTVLLDDGKDSVSKTFEIFVRSRFQRNTKTSGITASDYFDATQPRYLNPVITSIEGDLGWVTHDNYHAFKINARDFDGIGLEYQLHTAVRGFDSVGVGFDTSGFGGSRDRDVTSVFSYTATAGDTPETIAANLAQEINSAAIYAALADGATVRITRGADQATINVYANNVNAHADNAVISGFIEPPTYDQTVPDNPIDGIYSPFAARTVNFSGVVSIDGITYALEIIDPAEPQFDAVNVELEGLAASSTSIPTVYGLPEGMQLDATTGWVYGYIEPRPRSQTLYRFGVRVRKVDPFSNNPDDPNAFFSQFTYYELIVRGSSYSILQWITPSDLGIVRAGDISVIATVAEGTENIKYRLLPDSRIPNGTAFNETGSLSGRPQFSDFTLDAGDTTITRTTFDGTLEYRMHVEAYDSTMVTNSAGDIVMAGNSVINRVFTFKVDYASVRPYENLYAVVMPDTRARHVLSDLLDNPDIIEPAAVYRPQDSNFGKQRSTRLLVAAGINPTHEADYVDAMRLNHYRKDLRLGEVGVARAFVDNNVLYEVVYITVVDPVASAGFELPLPAPVANKLGQQSVFLNSVRNMRKQLVDTLEQSSDRALPLWQSTKQSSGATLGIVNAAPLVFVKPGHGERVKYKIQQQLASISGVKFDLDRYVWDTNLTNNYNHETGVFIRQVHTIFDTAQTVFDNANTRFTSNSLVYQQQDEGDKYLKFPRNGVINEQN